MENQCLFQTAKDFKNVYKEKQKLMLGTHLLCLIFYRLCYAAVLKILIYYAQYYAHAKVLLKI